MMEARVMGRCGLLHGWGVVDRMISSGRLSYGILRHCADNIQIWRTQVGNLYDGGYFKGVRDVTCRNGSGYF